MNTKTTKTTKHAARILALLALCAGAVFLTGAGGTAKTQYEYQAEDSNASWSASAVKITLNGTTAQVSGSGATASGSTVTVSKAGDYVLSGTFTGQIVVDAGKDDLVRLVLNGVKLSSNTGTPLYMKKAAKTVLILPAGTTNTVTDAVSYTFAVGEDEPDAAIFAKDSISITGTGSLTVKGQYRNGIAAKDALVITGGNITVDAVNDGLRGRDALAIRDGTLNVTAGNDGLKANNDTDAEKGYIVLDGGKYTIRAGFDGVQAETSLTVNGGTFDMVSGGGASAAPAQTGGFGGGMAGGGFGAAPGGTAPTGRGGGRMAPPDDGAFAMPRGGSRGFAQTQPSATTATTDSDSYKAFKAGAVLTINGGTFTVDARDDAFHANGNVTVANGVFTIKTGDDAFHADSALLVKAGTITVTTCYEGLEGATVDIQGGAIKITARDDGINAAGASSGPGDRFNTSNGVYVKISGGTVEVAAGGDGVDANGNVYLAGGTLKVSGPSQGMQGALDFDGTFTITGGRLITAGTSLSPAKTSTQPSLLVSYTSQVPAGSVITLADKNGKTLLEYTSAIACTASAFSAPELTAGSTYTVLIDGKKRAALTLSGTVTALAESGGAYSGGYGMGMGRGRGGW